jgi:Fur family transcriptional regulator, stress-responsive regulator
MAAADADRLRSPGLPLTPAARFEGRAGAGHHIVCRQCGAVASVDRVVGHDPCLQRATLAGFLVDEAEVTFWGRCAACRAAADLGSLP